MTGKRLQQVSITYSPITKTWSLLNRPVEMNKKKIKQVSWGAVPQVLHLRQAGKAHYMSKYKPVYFKALLQPEPNQLPMLGPLLGILTSRSKHAPFSGAIHNFKDISIAGQQAGCIVFVFTADGINFTKNETKGYIYHPALKKWISCTFPLPNVVYNRVPSRNAERKKEVEHCLNNLSKHPAIHLFNPHFFDKHELHQLLAADDKMAAYLPDTELLKDKSQLETMLKQYGSLYLKPTQGKAGIGILKAVYDPLHHRYYLYFHQGNQTKRLTASTINSFWKGIKTVKIKEPYLIQKAISLSHYQRSPFDIRTLVQKNKHGRWEVAGTGVRVAGINRITTHVPQGGQLGSVEDTLTQLFPDQTTQLKEQISELALQVAKTLEAHYKHLGEISLDIGLDRHGKLWVFEANAKPMKFDEPVIRKRSLINLIHYAQYLTFHQPKQGDELDDLARAN